MTSKRAKQSLMTAAAMGGLALATACAQSAEPAGESAGSTAEAYGEDACATVAISATGEGGGVGMPVPANYGMTVNGQKYVYCDKDWPKYPSYATPSGTAYPGDPSCPNQAILELTNPTGNELNFGVEPQTGNWPKNQADCESTFVTGTMYGRSRASGQWTKLYTNTGTAGVWEKTYCFFNGILFTQGGDLSQYDVIRLVGGEYQNVTSKGTTVQTPGPVNILSGTYCII